MQEYRLIGASLMCAICCLSFAPVHAAPGDLDSSFGSAGRVVTAYGGRDLFGPAIKVQADGKIVVAGKHYNGTNDDFLVQRYLSDGTLDTGFGTAGTAIITISPQDDNAKALAFQSDGKILVAGEGHGAGTYGQHALVRLNNNGAVDFSFGTGGKVMTDFGMSSHTHAVYVQGDGRIVVVGDVYAGETNGSFGIARYLSNGALDSSFGVGGTVVQKFGSNANGHAIVVQADGKLVIAGYTTNPTTGNDEFIIARYSAKGVIDTSFGSNGYSTVAIGLGMNYCHALLGQSDGKFILTGGALTSQSNDFALARFNSNGSLDTSFGSNGVVTTDFTVTGRATADETATGALQADGKIVVGGYANRQFAIARYSTTGALDTSFGSGGKVTAKIGTGNDDFIKSLALQADNKIVVVGYSKNDSTYNLALARFDNDSLVPSVPSAPMIVTTTPANASATVTINAPAFSGGSAITGYTVTSNPAGGVDTSAGKTTLTHTITGLTNGTTYTFTVKAANSLGAGVASDPSPAVTPAATAAQRSADCLFNWAESSYPDFFAPAKVASATAAPYYYRYYSGTATYLATSSFDNHVWALGPITGNKALDVGQVSSILTAAGCPA